MNILVVGRGGREHAITWAVSKSKLVDKIYVAPGNAGMLDIAELVNIDEMNNEALVAFAKEKKIDLTIVGPDAALMNGIVDAFENEGLRIFGPNKEAAAIEGDKEFAKRLMEKYGIPTAKYASFSNFEDASAYCLKHGAPIVIKYNGLAAGKGVTVAMKLEEAILALEDIFINSKFGGDKVVIEDFLDGKEFSLMAFVNGEEVYPMVEAQDHKRAFDGDKGPNTGGMGAFTPVTFVTKEIYEYSVREIMEKAAKAMVKEGRPFKGVLYGGLILTKNGPEVIEFNARFGDPETEVVLPRLESDIVEIIMDLLDGKKIAPVWNDKFTLGVVMASNGYPDKYKSDFLLEIPDNQFVFHMGTKKKDGDFYTNGGRVIFVIGQGNSIDTAREKAYNCTNIIKCENLFYRKDIGIK